MQRLGEQVDACTSPGSAGADAEITHYRSWLVSNRLNSEAVEASRRRSNCCAPTTSPWRLSASSRGQNRVDQQPVLLVRPAHAAVPRPGAPPCAPPSCSTTRIQNVLIFACCPSKRGVEASIAQFKRVPRHWVNITLDLSDPDKHGPGL